MNRGKVEYRFSNKNNFKKFLKREVCDLLSVLKQTYPYCVLGYSGLGK